MTSSSTVDVRAGVAAALVCAGAGFLAEFVLAAWAYRKPGFRSLRETVEREGRRADLARLSAAAGAGGSASSSSSSAASASASASSPSSSSSNKVKRAEKLQSSMKLELLKEMGVVRVKQVFIGLISMMGLLRIMTHNFEGVPLLNLPFEPFKMLRSVAHRGLKEEDALPAVAGYALIFMLVQAGLRPTLAKLIDGGPTRRMNELQVQYQTQVTESSGGVAGAAAAAAGVAARGGSGGGGGGKNNNLRRRR